MKQLLIRVFGPQLVILLPWLLLTTATMSWGERVRYHGVGSVTLESGKTMTRAEHDAQESGETLGYLWRSVGLGVAVFISWIVTVGLVDFSFPELGDDDFRRCLYGGLMGIGLGFIVYYQSPAHWGLVSQILIVMNSVCLVVYLWTTYRDFFEQLGYRQVQEQQEVEAKQREARHQQSQAEAQFARHEAERLHLEQIAAARQAAQSFYHTNLSFLKDYFPPQLFTAHLALDLNHDKTPDAAWRSCQALIRMLQELVERERSRRKVQPDRGPSPAEIERELNRLLATGIPADAIAEEMAAILKSRN